MVVCIWSSGFPWQQKKSWLRIMMIVPSAGIPWLQQGSYHVVIFSISMKLFELFKLISSNEEHSNLSLYRPFYSYMYTLFLSHVNSSVLNMVTRITYWWLKCWSRTFFSVSSCLRSWLENDTSCPTCRQSLASDLQPEQEEQRQSRGVAAFMMGRGLRRNHFFHFDGKVKAICS